MSEEGASATGSNNQVVLVSAEGAELVITEEEAHVSKALKHMLTSGESIEAQTRRIALPLFNKETLETVVRVSVVCIN